MRKILNSLEQLTIAKDLLRWSFLVIPPAVIIGLLVALFLWLLEWATATRWANLWLIFLLPLAGIAINLLYSKLGKNTDAGNNLIMDEIDRPQAGIPARMTPLILVTTVVTHLFGGSAGREGTAIQMGGSMASVFSRWYKMDSRGKRILLMSGMAAGFGAVFGTPVTGAIFAMEVLTIGRISYDALLPCLIASMVADVTCTAVGIHHTPYTISSAVGRTISFLPVDLLLLIKVIVSAIIFGLVSFAFTQLTSRLKVWSKAFIRTTWLIPVAGSFLIVGISYLIGNFDYLGLGVSNPNPGGVSIVSSFSRGGAHEFSWLFKLVLTAITLGMGFKGGEVTPLFFIGATLGNTLASLTGAPVDLFAGLGFIAVFAGATNTPLACTMMGIELFGADHVLDFAIACFTAYYFSGHQSIYSAQRIAVNKFQITDDSGPSAEPHDRKRNDQI